MALRMSPVALAISTLVLPYGAWAQTNEVTLPAVQVSASTERPSDLPSSYAGGQVAKGARLGLLGNQDVMDTPFNITSYTAQLIEGQGARTVADVLKNDPSVRFTTSGSHAYENFRLRGFDVHGSDLAINGMYGLAPMGNSSLEFVERVEVLKGPSALFTGMAPSGGIGGVINLVPKRAGNDPLTRVTLGYQSGSQFETKVDVGRRFGEEKSVGLRVNGSYSDGETDLKGQDKTRKFLSAALDYRGEQLTASLDVYSSKQKFDGGSPAMFGFANPDIPAAPDPSRNYLRSASGEMESQAVIARAEYAFNRQVSAFASVGVRDYDYSGWVNGTHIHSVQPDGRAQVRGVAQRGYDDSVASEAGVRMNFNTGDIRHEMVLQLTRLEMESGSLSSVTGMSNTSLNAPITPTLPAMPLGATPKTSDTTLSSLALVDTLSFMQDKVRLTLGLRQQRVQQKSYSTAGALTGDYDEKATTPAIGLVLKPWGEGMSLYANYVQGLSQGTSVKAVNGYAQDQTFKPYETEQKEVGVKWNAGSFTNTISLFEITKPELITTGKNPALVASDDGESRVRGLEWNVFGQLTSTIKLLGGLSYTKSKLTKTAGGVNEGNELFGVPRWQANLGAEWDTPLAGLSFSTNLIATSKQYLNNANTYEIPGWSQVDIGARYTTKVASHQTTFRVGVNNLFDRHYYSGSFAEPRATLAQGRTVQASVAVDF